MSHPTSSSPPANPQAAPSTHLRSDADLACPESCPHCRADLVGSCLAGLCGLHCVLAPLLVVAVPTFAGSWLVGEATEWSLLAAGALVGLWSTGRGMLRHHGRRHPLALATLALGLLLVARLAPESEARHETATAAAGALLLGTAHLRNRRLVRGGALGATVSVRPAAGEPS